MRGRALIGRARGRLSLTLVALAVSAATACWGQEGFPTTGFAWVYPAGGPAGQTLTVEVGGVFLDGLAAMETTVPGATAEIVAPGLDAAGVPSAASSRHFAIALPPECPPGCYEVRIRGLYGLSDPRPFLVFPLGASPLTAEGHTAEGAPELALGQVAVGRVENDLPDYFLVRGSPGEPVALRVLAGGLAGRLEPLLEAFDDGGRRIGIARDPFRHDPEIRFLLPDSGSASVRLTDLNFEGGVEFPYHLLRVGADGAPWFVGSRDLIVPARGRAAGDLTETRGRSPEAAEPLALPADITGVFPGGVSALWFSIEAAADESWAVDAVANGLGLPGDLAVALFKSDENGMPGDRLWEVDDTMLTSPLGGIGRIVADPSHVFSTGAGGRFLMRVENRGGVLGEPGRFRLAIARPQPSVGLFVGHPDPAATGNQVKARGPLLRDGGTIAFRVAALRRHGYSGEIGLVAEGLPAGVTAALSFIPDGGDSGLVILRREAGVDPGDWDGTIRICGSPPGGEPTIEATAVVLDRPVTDARKENVVLSRADDCRLALGSAADPAALSIQFPDGVAPQVDLNGKTEIPFQVTVHRELKGEVRIVLEGVPGLKKPPEIKIPKEGGEGRLVVEAKPDNNNRWRAGRFPLVLRAEAPVSYQIDPSAAARWEAEKTRVTQLHTDAVAARDEAKKAAASPEEITALSAKVDAAKGSLDRVSQFAKAAGERAKPADRRAFAFTNPVGFVVATPPPPEKEVGK